MQIKIENTNRKIETKYQEFWIETELKKNGVSDEEIEKMVITFENSQQFYDIFHSEGKGISKFENFNQTEIITDHIYPHPEYSYTINRKNYQIFMVGNETLVIYSEEFE